MVKLRNYYIKFLAFFIYLLIVTIVGLFFSEFVYQKLIYEDNNIIRVSDSVYGAFDPLLGVRYEPNSSISFSYILNGEIVECLKKVSKTNSDGFRGEDDLNDFRNAKIKIIVSGDSFSHWNNNNKTIVDYTKERLIENGLDVSLLNAAGGTFGIGQMIVNAAHFHEIHGGDHIVIQFIKDDLSRDWFFVDRAIDPELGMRQRLAHTIESLDIYSDKGADEYLVEPRATIDWCKENLDKLSDRSLVNEIEQKTKKIVFGNKFEFVFWKRVVKRVWGLRAIWKKMFGKESLEGRRKNIIPRIKSIEDVPNEMLESSISYINENNVSISFIFLPTSDHPVKFSLLEKQVISYYEQKLNSKFYYPNSYDFYRDVKHRAISPYDSHPSAELQQAYSGYLSSIIKRIVLSKSEPVE